jgi:hypothetical protein
MFGSCNYDNFMTVLNDRHDWISSLNLIAQHRPSRICSATRHPDTSIPFCTRLRR